MLLNSLNKRWNFAANDTVSSFHHDLSANSYSLLITCPYTSQCLKLFHYYTVIFIALLLSTNFSSPFLDRFRFSHFMFVYINFYSILVYFLFSVIYILLRFPLYIVSFFFLLITFTISFPSFFFYFLSVKEDELLWLCSLSIF